ncbi:MAG: glycosyltransferase family 2 protein [Gemmatimonadota bacterium]
MSLSAGMIGARASLDALLTVAAVPSLAATTYLGVLAARARENVGGSADWSAPVTRFDVIIPAHDEEDGITRTITSLAAVDYPAALFRIVVIADNCSDATALRAREPGATVLERVDPDRRGKGYALSFAFETLLQEGLADAMVVVDADTSVSPLLLRAFDQAIQQGHEALQAHYGVRDADQSWRTRLAHLGLVLFHGVRSSARESMGVSCGLRGNGMCFRASLLRRVPHEACSLVEDLEYGIALGQAGVRVHFVESAWVRGDMPSTSSASRTQRARWEDGRRALRGRFGWPLLRDGLRARDGVLLDLGLDLLVPPLSTVAVTVAIGLLLAAGLTAIAGTMTVALVLWLAALAGLLGYIGRGCAMTAAPVRTMMDLLWAPLFIVWKLTIRTARPSLAGEWIRTARTPLARQET